jgi:hypothetical protein
MAGLSRTGVKTRYFFNPNRFRIFAQKDNAGRLQKGSPLFVTWTASHSSHNVNRLHVVFGQGQSFRMVGVIYHQPDTD